MSDPKDKYYTYLWLREDGTPYYVGKGTRDRAFIKHRVGKPPAKDRILLQIFPSEEDAYSAEIFLISYYGKEIDGTGFLLNLTDGGEGAIPSEDTRLKISKTLKRKGIRPPSRKGCKLTKEQRDKQSAALKGHMGYIPTEEQRKKRSVFMLGKTYHKGFKNSEESKLRMSIAAKIRPERKRTERGTYV